MANRGQSSYHVYTRAAAGHHVDYDWKVRAACRSETPTPQNVRDRSEIFFDPDGRGTKKRREQRLQAQLTCLSCPVIQACHDYRERLKIEYGVWGGKVYGRWGAVEDQHPLGDTA